MSMAAGWYPDPMGLWDARWWDGVAWHDAVTIGRHQDEEPMRGLDALVATGPGDGLVWQGHRSGDPSHTALYVLTGRALRVYKKTDRPPVDEWLLWKVQAAEPRIKAGQSVRGVGDVTLTIAYAGFAGRSTEVLRGVSEPDRVAALITRYARLARLILAQGAPPPPGG